MSGLEWEKYDTAVSLILKELGQSPRTMKELSSRTGLSSKLVRALVYLLEVDGKVESWERGGVRGSGYLSKRRIEVTVELSELTFSFDVKGLPIQQAVNLLARLKLGSRWFPDPSMKIPVRLLEAAIWSVEGHFLYLVTSLDPHSFVGCGSAVGIVPVMIEDKRSYFLKEVETDSSCLNCGGRIFDGRS